MDFVINPAKKVQNARLTAFVKSLWKQGGIVRAFDESLWGCMAEHIMVGGNEKMTISFRNGTEI